MKHYTPNNVCQVDLGLLWSPNDLFSDVDSDGYVDQLNIELGIAPGLANGNIWAGLINLGVRLNIECNGAYIGNLRFHHKPRPGMLLVRPVSSKYKQGALLEQALEGGWILAGNNPLAIKSILNSLAMAPFRQYDNPAKRIEVDCDKDKCVIFWNDASIQSWVLSPAFPAKPKLHKGCSLSQLHADIDLVSITPSIFIKSEKEARGTRLELGLDLPNKLSASSGQALFSLIGAASARATEVKLPLAGVGARTGHDFCLKLIENRDPEAWLKTDGKELLLAGGNTGMTGLLKNLERLWFEADAPGGEVIEEWRSRLYKSALLAAGVSSDGILVHKLIRGLPLPELLPGKRWRRLGAACRRIGASEPKRLPAKPPVLRQSTWKSEEKRLLTLAGKIPKGTGKVAAKVFLSGSRSYRNSFESRLKHLLQEKGYVPEIENLRAHKPAVSWLLEVIEPQLPMPVERLEISCSPFLRDGRMEMVSRWVQEMYPAPDIICRRRGWGLDCLQMSINKGQEEAYLVRAFNGAGDLLVEEGLTPPLSKIPYLLEGDVNRFSYPVCASIEISKNEQLILNHQISTDRELFWHRFQQSWLPEMEADMLAALPGLLKNGLLAFWEEIRFEIAINEGQENLDFAEERIAPMEALHEDIYFGLLAFCKAFCQRHGVQTPLNLGRIIPIVNSDHVGDPVVKLRLKPVKPVLRGIDKKTGVSAIGYSRGVISAELSRGQEKLKESELKKLSMAASCWGYRFLVRDGKIIAQMKPAPKRSVPQPTADIQEPNIQAIPTGEEITTWNWSLNGQSGIEVWRAGQSLMGRDIVAVEAISSGRMQAGRARLLKPTLFINARHHANEVSGTNGAIKLLYDLTQEQKNTISAGILAGINVVVVPVENPDGVATFEEMLPQAPNHKLHAARYNALGMEWYDEYFNPNTVFSEARVKTRLYERWLPEYMLDLHGVPSHEWEQPYAGYINPHFREHWIPRSFVYAIMPYYDKPEHPGALESKELAEELSTAMAAETDIAKLNKEIYHRYARYAKAFEPEVYHSELAGSLVVVPPGERIGKSNFAIRNWPLVKSEVITEVLDEVAHGPWLGRCTRAHLVVIKTMIKRMRMQREDRLTLKRYETSDGLTFVWTGDDR